jgi:hypothetical protein
MNPFWVWGQFPTNHSASSRLRTWENEYFEQFIFISFAQEESSEMGLCRWEENGKWKMENFSPQKPERGKKFFTYLAS